HRLALSEKCVEVLVLEGWVPGGGHPRTYVVPVYVEYAAAARILDGLKGDRRIEDLARARCYLPGPQILPGGLCLQGLAIDLNTLAAELFRGRRLPSVVEAKGERQRR